MDTESLRARLLELEEPCSIPASGDAAITSAAVQPATLGDPGFQDSYSVSLSYAAGAMANGIASEALVEAMAGQGLLASFGAAGLLPDRIAAAIDRLEAACPGRPYAFNLIHNPSEDVLERRTVELYLQRQVAMVEASAFLDLTPHVVRYRVAGLRLHPDGQIERRNRLIAKVSRREIATKFLEPAPAAVVAGLVRAGEVTEQQAALAARVPMCDDLTVEADSGGHTDNRPLVCLLPSMIELRNEIQARHRFETPVRVGAAGGISTPAAALAAFMMGAAYVVTGSVNQSCREAGCSPHTKALLAEAGMADVMMAPAADMFEMGVKVQLLKRGTFFPMRAQRLYELYQRYESLTELPDDERERLERQVFRRGLDQIWDEVQRYFHARDPQQIARAEDNPKRKMALIFRWYLGLSSRWSNSGEQGREMDYQIWCGPAMGAFNDWVRGSYLEAPERRSVVDVARNIMRGAAYLYRLQDLTMKGVRLPAELWRYRPEPLSTPALSR